MAVSFLSDDEQHCLRSAFSRTVRSNFVFDPALHRNAVEVCLGDAAGCEGCGFGSWWFICRFLSGFDAGAEQHIVADEPCGACFCSFAAAVCAVLFGSTDEAVGVGGGWKSTMKLVVIHSDGGCHGNPGPGGWGVVLAYGKHVREIKGGVAATTNNRMELQAAIEALRCLKEACEIEFHTDSQYVRQGITQWVVGWKSKGWRTSTKQPVKNEDLWRELDLACNRHTIRWHWVKGHAGHRENERCDELANEAIAQIKASHSLGQLRQMLDEFRGAARMDLL